MGSLLFSEIWQQNVFSYVDVRYKKIFQDNTFIAALGAQKWLKTTPKWPKMGQNDTFPLITFDPFIKFF